jgi:hypothetical protein
MVPTWVNGWESTGAAVNISLNFIVVQTDEEN